MIAGVATTGLYVSIVTLHVPDRNVITARTYRSSSAMVNRYGHASLIRNPNDAFRIVMLMMTGVPHRWISGGHEIPHPMRFER